MTVLAYRLRIRTASAETTSDWLHPDTRASAKFNTTEREVHDAVVQRVTDELQATSVISVPIPRAGDRHIVVAAIEWFEVDVELRADLLDPELRWLERRGRYDKGPDA